MTIFFQGKNYNQLLPNFWSFFDEIVKKEELEKYFEKFVTEKGEFTEISKIVKIR